MKTVVSRITKRVFHTPKAIISVSLSCPFKIIPPYRLFFKCDLCVTHSNIHPLIPVRAYKTLTYFYSPNLVPPLMCDVQFSLLNLSTS